MLRRLLGLKGEQPIVDRMSIDPQAFGPEYTDLRAHVLERIALTAVGEAPFYHLYIDHLFPEAFYEALKARMVEYKNSGKLQTRKQDSKAFVNRRYPLIESRDVKILQFRALFEDRNVKRALFEKFYYKPSDDLVDSVDIHENEFEFVFCTPDKFQNVHVDIPPKYMSFVFYFPTIPVDEEEEKKNATVLYDKELKPVYGANFRRNSVCVFVPHFYSYHGFSTTIERDVLVMFLINKDEMRVWHDKSRSDSLQTGFSGIADMIEDKLVRHPLIEYGGDLARISEERAACRINAPQGRVMFD